MNEDGDTRGQDGIPIGAEPATGAASSIEGDVWARAAEQAVRDVARAKIGTTAPENSTA